MPIIQPKNSNNQKVSDFDDGKDPLFPDNLNSLDSKNREGYLYDYQKPTELEVDKSDIEFKSLEDCFGEFALEDKIHSEKSNQGQLGDCYFLEVILSLSQFSKILINRIRKIKSKLYELIFLIDGIETKILITDTVPIIKSAGLPLFVSPNQEMNLYYLCLFEKALAKICGGYSNIEGGFSYEIANLLLGYESEFKDMESIASNDNEMNKLIKDIQKLKNEGNAFININISTGYQEGHALTLVGINEKYIIIKDPHGRDPYNPETPIFLKRILTFITGEYKNDYSLANFIEIPKLIKEIDELLKNINDSEKERISKNFKASGLLEVPIELLKLKINYFKKDKREETFLFMNLFFNYLPLGMHCRTFKIKNLQNPGKLVLIYTKKDKSDFDIKIETISNYWRAHRNYIDYNHENVVNPEIKINTNNLVIKIDMSYVEIYQPYSYNSFEEKKRNTKYCDNMKKKDWAILQEKGILQKCIITELDRFKEEDISILFNNVHDKNREKIIDHINLLDDIETINLYEKIRIYIKNQICFRIFSNHKIHYESVKFEGIPENEIKALIQIQEKEKFKLQNKLDIEFSNLIKNNLENSGLKYSIEYNGLFSQKFLSNDIESFIYMDQKDFNQHIEKIEKDYKIYISGKKSLNDEITGQLIIKNEKNENIKQIELDGINNQKRFDELIQYLKDENIMEENIKMRLETKIDSDKSTSIDDDEETSPIADGKGEVEILGANIGKGETGGVEFVYPKSFIHYSDLFYYSPIHYIAFKCSKDSEKDIIDTVNRLLVPGIKVNNLSEIWETILSELSNGFLINHQLPFVSLHFNQNCLLYSVMNNYYKRTLVGHILCFLDFFLKGFMNGGFYKEGFVYNWYLTGKNENKDYLRENFIDLKGYLYKNGLSDLNYNSLHEIGDDILFESKQAFKSSSRIIGNMEDILKVCDNIIFPNCNYNVEGDFDIFPEFLAKLSLKEQELNNFIMSAQKTRVMMKMKCFLIMDKIPYFKSYFILLQMITFALNYLPTLKNNCQCPVLNFSLVNLNKPYVKNLPTVFPPIPIYNRTKIKPNRTLKDFINMLDPNLKAELNNEIRKQKNSSFLSFPSILRREIKEQISKKYKEYLLSITDKKEDIKKKTNYELSIEVIMDKIFSLLNKLFEIPNIQLGQIYNFLIKNEKIKEKFKEPIDKYISIQDKINILKEIFNVKKEFDEKEEFEDLQYLKNLEENQENNKKTVSEQKETKQKILDNMEKSEEIHRTNLEKIKEIYENNKKEFSLELQKNAKEVLEKSFKQIEAEYESNIKQLNINKEENLKKLNEEIEKLKGNKNIDESKLDKKIKEIEEEINKKFKDKMENMEQQRKQLKSENEQSIKEQIEQKRKKNDELEEQRKIQLEKEENEKHQNIINISKEQLQYYEELIKKNETIINDVNEKINNTKNGIEKNKKIRNDYYNLNRENFDFIVEKYEKEQYLDFCGSFIPNLCNDIVILEMNFENRNESSVRGGCLAKINNKIICIENKDLVSKDMLEVIKSKNNSFQYNNSNLPDKNYLILKTKIQNGFFKEVNNLIINTKILNCVKNNQKCDLKDNFGLSSGHYKMLCHDKKIYETIKKQELEQKTFYGEKPEIYAILSKNKKAVKYLIDKGDKNFNLITDNGLNPLLYSILIKTDGISKLLINHLSSKDLNYSTESKITPLHYTVKNNNLKLTKLLVKKGALITNNNNTDGSTPFHLACEKGYNDIIDFFSTVNCDGNEKIERPDKQTVLHRAVKNSK